MCNLKGSVVLRRVHNLKRISINAGLRGYRQIVQQLKQFFNLKRSESIFIVTLLFDFYALLFVLFIIIMTPFFKVAGSSFPHFPWINTTCTAFFIK